jgi:regulatory protein YycH of two-component signal transduction system YycFG
MQVKIKNSQLGQVYDLLFNLSLRGKQNRHRNKLNKKLTERLQEVVDQEKELLKEHCHLDEKGEPKLKKDGKHWDVKDLDAFSKDKKELYEEEFVIEGGGNRETLKVLKQIITELYEGDQEWQGQEGVTFDLLCDVFEVDEEEENGKDDE